MITRRDLLKSAFLLPAMPGLLDRAANGQEAAPRNATWLEPVAQQILNEFQVPAIWLAASIGDKIESVAVGVRKFDEPTQAAPDDKLMMASVTKPMTGLWIATIVAKGLLSYDTRALDVLPELEKQCLPEHQ